jgi:cyanate permease
LTASNDPARAGVIVTALASVACPPLIALTAWQQMLLFFAVPCLFCYWQSFALHGKLIADRVFSAKRVN